MRRLDLTPEEKEIAWMALALFALVAYWAIVHAPMSMDEALYYHPLACSRFPAAALHVFRDGCDHRDDLKIFGLTVPMAYPYVGPVAAWLYAPIYDLFKSPMGQYLFGLAACVAFAFALSRLMARRALAFCLFLAFFPFVFQFIHDTGPIKISSLAFPLSALFVPKVLTFSKRKQVLSGGAWGALALLACYDKVSFLYLMPGLALFSLVLLDKNGAWPAFAEKARKLWLFALAALAVVVAGVALFMTAQTGQGDTFLVKLMDLPLGRSRGFMDYLQGLFLFTFFWPSYAHRVFSIGLDVYSVMGAAIILMTLVLYVLSLASARALAKRWMPTPRVAMLGGSALAIVLVYAVFGNVWAGHHYIALWVPLIVLIVDVVSRLEKQAQFLVTTLYLFISLASWIFLMSVSVGTDVDRDRDQLFARLQDDKQAAENITVFASWGGYFIQSLYGPPSQLVVFLQPLDPDNVEKLLALSRSTGRRIQIACQTGETVTFHAPQPVSMNACSPEYLEAAFHQALTFTDATPDLTVWKLFEGKAR